MADTPKAILQECEDKMKRSLESLNHQYVTIRSGRANPAMVDHLKVDYYGTMTPLKQLANVSVPEPKSLMISPWDVSAVKLIEKAILESDLGINPIVDGKGIRLVVPTLTRERREELAKIAAKIAEETRVSLRTERRDANEHAKKIEKEKKITEDESFKLQSDVQKLTDRYIQLVDQSQSQKEKELSQI